MREDEPVASPPPSARRSAAASPSRRRPPPPVSIEIAEAVGERRSGKVERLLVDAARAFERDRFQEGWRILRPLTEEAPDVSAVRELAGVTLYRLGRWAQAAGHLEAFVRLTGSVEQHPVLADCYRALKRYKAVAELWDELREASPGAALVTEGRIVAAGALADQGDVDGAIKLLEKGPVRPNRTSALHHARLWYALADLYERAGELPRARELFRSILRHEHDFVDVPERLAALG